MSGSVSADANSFALVRQMLPEGRSLGGILEAIEPVGDGLIRVSVSGRKYCMPEDLHEKLASLVGQRVAIGRHFGEFRGGAL